MLLRLFKFRNGPPGFSPTAEESFDDEIQAGRAFAGA